MGEETKREIADCPGCGHRGGHTFTANDASGRYLKCGYCMRKGPPGRNEAERLRLWNEASGGVKAKETRYRRTETYRAWQWDGGQDVKEFPEWVQDLIAKHCIAIIGGCFFVSESFDGDYRGNLDRGGWISECDKTGAIAVWTAKQFSQVFESV